MKTITLSATLFKKVEAYWGNEFLMYWNRGKPTSPHAESLQFKKADAHQIFKMIEKVLEKADKVEEIG